MSDIKKKTLTVSEYYDNLCELNGAVMDTISYEKHKAEIPTLEKEDKTEYLEQESATLDDIFSAPQDFRQIAARQIEADRQMEYRPECATYSIPRYTGESCIETEERHFVLGTPYLVCTGSGSYLSSGSYGSYITSGSYKTSGSFHSGSGSFHLSEEVDTEQPYMGSFGWDFETGGYGINLI